MLPEDIYGVVREVVDSNLRLLLFGGDLSLTSPMLHSRRFASKLGYEVTYIFSFKSILRAIFVVQLQ